MRAERRDGCPVEAAGECGTVHRVYHNVLHMSVDAQDVLAYGALVNELSLFGAWLQQLVAFPF